MRPPSGRTGSPVAGRTEHCSCTSPSVAVHPGASFRTGSSDVRRGRGASAACGPVRWDGLVARAARGGRPPSAEPGSIMSGGRRGDRAPYDPPWNSDPVRPTRREPPRRFPSRTVRPCATAGSAARARRRAGSPASRRGVDPATLETDRGGRPARPAGSRAEYARGADHTRRGQGLASNPRGGEPGTATGPGESRAEKRRAPPQPSRSEGEDSARSFPARDSPNANRGTRAPRLGSPVVSRCGAAKAWEAASASRSGR